MSINMLYRNKTYRRYFFLLAGGLFIALFLAFYLLGLVPEELIGAPTYEERTVATNPDTQNTPEDEPAVTSVTRPSRINIPSVGIDTSVSHPGSADVSVLDNALLKGAVYYPGSGSIEQGNAFVFGHSTGLSVVNNQAFKAFNNLKKVTVGDEIFVTGEDGRTYVYEAISMELVNDDEAFVTFDTTSRMLTLSTCNTFGAKQERHVVKAQYVREVDSIE